MNYLKRLYIELKRAPHSMGFGILSPTDYRFARSVISESWPYYAYDDFDKETDCLKQKLAKLYFRLANFRQPRTIIDMVGAAPFAQRACPHAEVVKNTAHVDIAFVPIECEYQQLLDMCDDHSVVVFEGINRKMPLWHCIEYDQRTTITFDLYYCGIVLFDHKRSKQNYIINF